MKITLKRKKMLQISKHTYSTWNFFFHFFTNSASLKFPPSIQRFFSNEQREKARHKIFQLGAATVVERDRRSNKLRGYADRNLQFRRSSTIPRKIEGAERCPSRHPLSKTKSNYHWIYRSIEASNDAPSDVWSYLDSWNRGGVSECSIPA